MQLSVFVDDILARLLSGNRRTVSVFTFHYVKDNGWDTVTILLKFGVFLQSLYETVLCMEGPQSWLHCQILRVRGIKS
jgi:hypothetical protein